MDSKRVTPDPDEQRIAYGVVLGLRAQLDMTDRKEAM